MDTALTSRDAIASATSRQWTFITGIQALVRLPMIQRERDRTRNFNTAGLISGYRGSPLGAYDQQLWKASKQLAAHDIVFQPGLNEDLAATALWGAQVHTVFGETKVDGVFGIWYGKGPGVDRTGDVFRNANMMGTSKLGGVLAISGDDHAAQSSMWPHQTDGIFHSASIPVLQPSNVREVIEFGLAGIEMSRYAGLWVSLKTIAEVVETAATIDMGSWPTFREPTDFAVPAHGLNWDPTLSWPAQRGEYERRLIDERLPAARAWARANQLDRVILAAPTKRLGIVTVGKAHQDFMQACQDLGLSDEKLRAMGVSVYKVAMSWPLETEGASQFAAGNREVLVIEEKRSNVEAQLKDALFHRPESQRPVLTGKTDAAGNTLLPEAWEFSSHLVARALVRRLEANGVDAPDIRERLSELDAAAKKPAAAVIPVRAPFFCSGCPHNTSTRTPEGSISGGGIGCHVIALSQPALKTKVASHMGGEGAQWIGAAPFSKTAHVFQNLGDGTYQHSGLLAIRAAVAAKTNITYKILYNDAVAMTGGQPTEGTNDPAGITRQLQAEGIEKIAFVTDDPTRWQGNKTLAPGVGVYHRDELDAVQRQLREVPGVTAIVYEQTCAAEKRRRRKRKELPDPDRRVFINHEVCEGCGDCSVQSNCISVEPLETPLGRKRAINQSACNKDFSCVKGFCPSFVEVEGVKVRKPDSKRVAGIEAELVAALPAPKLPALGRPFNIYITGIGGSGVLTMGAILGAAAGIDGLASTVLDFTGMSQKNGAVVSQVRIAATDDQIAASRIGEGNADLLLGADLVVSAAPDSLLRLSASRTAAVLNLAPTPTPDFITDRDATPPMKLMQDRVRKRCSNESFHAFDAGTIAQSIFGDTLPTHTLMLGYAWQKGLVPLSRDAINHVIERNGAAVDMNKSAFNWGRIIAAKPDALAAIEAPKPPSIQEATTLDQLVEIHRQRLVEYQGSAYAKRYVDLVMLAREADARIAPKHDAFATAVARSAYKLMAYKDEYEVARLYTTPAFRESLMAQFSDAKKVSIWLAPPLLSSIDPRTGRPKKRKFGPWIFPVLKVVAGMRELRGTALDIFGYTAERRAERRLVAEYFDDIRKVCSQLSLEKLDQAITFASLPMDIRGFGPVKERAIQDHVVRRANVLAALSGSAKSGDGGTLSSNIKAA
ncbi:indolepyruvate ferredoxin oxidoreductase [Trinickia symbiotica]|uniref:Indolepyruvate ferredoxin oxidoreductase n=1 Tax=Trinickia symbiotica TaxID=863227 RepID=A0A2N7XAF0_9BURK|nr:indolepyruvate ferredoxin oxidoreductase family protein [Trinickia symbiotica]PMS38435.1 indolepyruvate ferredoxin oxidoreductase [Trinickia symbiotica]PPK46447.1 indolepyruvate ferredoxin oxidoreductase [Trinickia symbiotica]